jgi:hypothetical protein
MGFKERTQAELSSERLMEECRRLSEDLLERVPRFVGRFINPKSEPSIPLPSRLFRQEWQ